MKLHRGDKPSSLRAHYICHLGIRNTPGHCPLIQFKFQSFKTRILRPDSMELTMPRNVREAKKYGLKIAAVAGSCLAVFGVTCEVLICADKSRLWFCSAGTDYNSTIPIHRRAGANLKHATVWVHGPGGSVGFAASNLW